MKTIVVAGATGFVGQLVITQLLDSPSVSKVIAIVRNSLNLNNPKLEEVLLVEGKLSREINADGYICCIGTTIKKAGTQQAFQAVDLDLPVSLGKHLRTNGCVHAAVISSLGADKGSRNFYLRTKGQMEDNMQKVGFESLTIVRPSIIDGKRKENRMGERIGLYLAKKLSFLFIGSLRKYRPTPARAIAQRLIDAVITPTIGIHIIEKF